MADRATTAEERPRLFRGKGWFWIPILPLIALDLWSKWAVFDHLERTFGTVLYKARLQPVFPEDWPIRFDFVQWWNTGTIWGLGQDYNLPLRILRVAALFLLVYFAWRTPRERRFQQLVLGLILAGAVGNLWDNFTQAFPNDPERDGGVRDFLLFSARIDGEVWRFPAFNVADSCICVGAFALAILLWRADATESTSAKA